ncbi:MAG: LysR family transcriptional regulator [Anaerotignum sp.]|nr:LysR family transcriptional regulator [Anaerotignum sp.]
MRAATSVYFYKNDVRFFGEGPCRLLRGIEECGSLRAAAAKMNLSYSKAITMVNRAEEALGFHLTEKQIGGKGGGGSRLTPKAIAFLEKYEAYREACYEANRKLYLEFFSE